jgi:glycosyltransferase involved in cell wall biosynthesis
MKNLNINCPINQTGYGIASLNILKELNKKYNVSYFPIGEPGVTNQLDFDIIKNVYEKQQSFDIHAPLLKIWHQFDLASHIGKGSYYAYPFFELDTFNNIEKKHMSIPDTLFVSSKWAQSIIYKNGIKTPTSVVPLGVDTDVFKPKPKINNNYIFLTIGKWEIRKSHDILPQIFKQAFPNEKDVELWILASENTNSYSNSEEIAKWKKLYYYPNIKVIPGVNTHIDIADIISQSDCGLYISRAEGWNMELLETMAMNKPAIATNYSAHTEFCNSDNCYLIDIDSTEEAYDGKAFQGQGNWAKIEKKQIDQTIDYMRHVYKNRISTNENGLKTAQIYSWKNSADIISGCIN